MYDDHHASWCLYSCLGLGTPLHRAADDGNIELVQFLLDQGADTTIKDTKERNALDLAVISNHEDVVAILLSATEDQRLKLRL
ncbi:hypothetical protein BJX99DRAFT_219635 [Aspergillus californicus]